MVFYFQPLGIKWSSITNLNKFRALFLLILRIECCSIINLEETHGPLFSSAWSYIINQRHPYSLPLRTQWFSHINLKKKPWLSIINIKEVHGPLLSTLNINNPMINYFRPSDMSPWFSVINLEKPHGSLLLTLKNPIVLYYQPWRTPGFSIINLEEPQGSLLSSLEIHVPLLLTLKT